MTTIPRIDEDPESWDTVVIGGVVLPGVAGPEGVKSPRDLDVQKAKGKTKATVKDNGNPPRKPKIVWRFDATDPVQWAAAMRAIDEVIEPRKETKTLSPVEVIHPLFARHQIRTCLIQDYDGPIIEHGLATVTIELLEYEKPKPAAGIGGTAKGTGGSPPEYILALLQHELNAVAADLQYAAAAGDEQALLALAAKKQAILNKMAKPSSKGPQQNL
ncbi:MAG: hypothetical protein KF718_33300 [Polyangiaceae bacterium]|nr:hypothetical protein [Polyangiaceae bacterium]